MFKKKAMADVSGLGVLEGTEQVQIVEQKIPGTALRANSNNLLLNQSRQSQNGGYRDKEVQDLREEIIKLRRREKEDRNEADMQMTELKLENEKRVSQLLKLRWLSLIHI